MSTSDPTADLQASTWAFQATAAKLITEAITAGGHDGATTFFGEGIDVIVPRLARLERATKHTVYNLQRRPQFDPLRRERPLNQRSRERRLRGHMITSSSDYLSLIAACHPDTWVAPVDCLGIAIDERVALLPGPTSRRGLPTAWLCRDTDLVMQFCELWTQTKRMATPIRDAPGVTPLTERQLDVVSLLSHGYKDAAIARHLGVSLRTVTSDVGRVLDALGAATRWEAGIAIGRATGGAR